jgi:hypothetical protein
LTSWSCTHGVVEAPALAIEAFALLSLLSAG